MPITITISGDNAEHAVKELVGYVAGLHGELTKLAGGKAPAPAIPAAAQPAANTAAPAAPAAAPAAAVAPAAEAPKGKGKKAAAAPAAPPAQEVVLPDDDEGTLDNARAWIQAVNGKLGLDAAAKIITSFGVKKVGEIDASKFDDFIGKCKAALTPGAAPAASNVADMM